MLPFEGKVNYINDPSEDTLSKQKCIIGSSDRVINFTLIFTEIFSNSQVNLNKRVQYIL